MLYSSEVITQRGLNGLEKFYIRKYKSLYSEKLGGTNIIEGASIEINPASCDIVRKKISLSLMGRKFSKQHINNLKKYWTSERLSGEKNPNYGHKWTREMKDKMRAVKLGKYVGEKNPNYGNKWSDEDHPDAVHICTPHYLHVEMSVEALSRDIHVLCEKPCAMNREELAKIRMAQLMSTHEYGVCFQNRYNSSVRAIKNTLETGKYGAIKGARAVVQWCRNEDYYSDDWHGTLRKEGGGVVINQGIHTQDLLRYLVGSDVVSVTGHVANDHLKDKIEVEDTARQRLFLLWSS